MAYQKHRWYNGEVVQAQNLNHMEEGIESAVNSSEPATNAEIDDLFTGHTPSAASAKHNIDLGNLARYYSKETDAINEKTAVMVGATAGAAGKKGLVSQPMQGDQGKFLRGDGTWQTIEMNDMTGATSSTPGTHGLAPAPAAGDQNKFLRGDGTWQPAIDGSVYQPAGSIPFASLPSLGATSLGKVYDITDEFTSTSSFTDGGGKSYPAGTNVAIVNIAASGASPVYKYDCLAGIVDLSNLVAAINKVDGDVGDKSTLTTTNKTSLVAAINEVDGDVGDKTNLTTTAKTSLVAAINELDGKKLDVVSTAPSSPSDEDFIFYVGSVTGDFTVSPGVYKYDLTNTKWVLQAVGEQSFTASFTLDSTDWVSHEQTVSVTGLNATDNGSIGLPITATAAQIEAAAEAKFAVTISAGSVTFTAVEDPTVNIPVVLTVVR